ncbi:hypothetical protein [Streptomyces sp. NPDC005969]|uniref:hypothetical protein n=1 Tax=Streptomyces sp. NPDC005969 TaxID=3156722 RepID=UPI003405A9B1
MTVAANVLGLAIAQLLDRRGWLYNALRSVPLILLGPASEMTVTVGIYRAIGEHQSDFGQVFALMFLATLPILVFCLASQRHFVKGLTGGATKG